MKAFAPLLLFVFLLSACQVVVPPGQAKKVVNPDVKVKVKAK